MDHSKKKLLYKTYQIFLDSFIKMDIPAETLKEIVSEDIMGFGTTLDERIVDYSGYLNLIDLQRMQSEGASVEFDLKNVFGKVTPDGNSALFVKEGKVALTADGNQNIIPLRLTTSLFYEKDSWKVIHWHGSTGVNTEKDTWHKEELQKKNDELEKLVVEKTADLESKKRELEIESAMERIRVRTLLMKDSKELNEAVAVFFKEFSSLNLLPPEARTYFCDINTGTDIAEVWMTFTNGEVMPDSHHTPLNRSKTMKKYYEAWKRQDPISIRDYKGKSLSTYLNFVSTLPHVKKDKDYKKLFQDPPKKIVMTDANFLQGNIGIMTFEPLSKEALDILIRFAKVFEFTYTRFLDLKKAEAQALEAQIEASLERMRAQMLAMHTSSDMEKACVVMYEQLEVLGVVPEGAGVYIAVLDQNTDTAIQWLVSDKTLILPFDEERTPLTEHKLLIETYNGWKRKDPVLIRDLSGVELKEFTDYLLSLPWQQESKFNSEKIPDRMIWTEATFSHGTVGFIHLSPLPEADIEILIRFSRVFDLTYQRFLDLQKAEAQAKEAQIEAALERVRSRTMAMHSSDEFREVVGVVFKELQLSMDTQICILLIFNSKRDEIEWWSTGMSIDVLPMSYKIPIRKEIKANALVKRYLKALQKGVEYSNFELSGKTKLSWDKYLFEKTELKQIPKETQKAMMSFEGVILSDAFMSHGTLEIAGPEPLSDDDASILQRFANVINQTYTRFLDLQKAEAQAREAQIEAALERVRSRTMTMHMSEELADVIDVVFRELRNLGFQSKASDLCIIDKKTNHSHLWISGELDHETIYVQLGNFKNNHHKKSMNAWKNGEQIQRKELKGKVCHDYMQSMINNVIAGHFPDHVKKFLIQIKRVVHTDAFNQYGFFRVAGLEYLSEEEEDILLRFTIVFEQTYTRFLDLQKAEAQAREAQVEAALERVRARTMAIQKTDELLEAGELLYRELAKLGISSLTSGYALIEESAKIDWSYMVSPEDGSIYPEPLGIPRDETHVMRAMTKSWKNQEPYHVQELNPEETIIHQTYIAEHTKNFGFTAAELISFSPESLVIQTFNFRNGYIMMIGGERLSEAQVSIMIRFTKTFEQTYTRFLDLQKAEAQAREAEIELSLERIRAQATAMKESSDLLDIVVTMRKEFVALGHEAQYFWHMRWLPEKYEKAMTSGDGTRIGMVMTLPRHIHGDVALVDQWEKGNEPALVFPMGIETAVNYVDKMISLGDFEQVDPNAPSLDDVRHIGGLTFIMARTTHGEIGYSLPGDVPHPPADGVDTLTRFAGAFDLAYRRFEDLQKAEAQAREAVKQASLDRVRGEIASMRSTEDLNRITPLIWQELIVLGVSFIRCGVFIMDEKNETIESHLSSPDGKSLGLLHLPYEADKVGNNAVKYWRKGEIYKDHWNKQQFEKFMQRMVKLGRLENTEEYQGAASPPDSLDLHFVPFKQGMLYVGNTSPLDKEEITLVQSLAQAFSIAYARYEDFTQLERALGELRSTQSQLIHSEKMASLGELTAGIAHEIQNPLNFVNNFSEVSEELITELKEELDNGDIEEAKIISDDVVQNLQKIHHHGQRASGIVKGMLEHSRTGDGKKDLTDINALADEYLRLAYHGLRAKDKSFNADFRSELDPSLPEVKVIAQDMGRVILNMINNAFYAVASKAKSARNDQYKPEVFVSTKRNDKKVEIAIQDNGDGIPSNHVDKIFQPFFTTKPTGQGTGLGLSLSYDIITQGHDGHLEVETEEGIGTRFIIEIPLTT